MSDVIDLGDNHILTFCSYEGESRVACNIKHLTKDGNECNGFIAFRGRAWEKTFTVPNTITAWDVIQDEPLTLTPSILCRGCGDHGFVTNGRWIKA